MVSGIARRVGGAQSRSIKMASSIVLHDEVSIYFKFEYRRHKVLSGQSQELRTPRVSVDYTVAKEGPVCQVPKHLQ